MNKFTRTALFSLTEKAAGRIKYLISQKSEKDVRISLKKLYLKIGVRRRGCNGLSYTMNYSKEISKLDEVVEQHGVKIVVDSKAVMFIVGTKMDFVEDDLKSEFIFINPNSKVDINIITFREVADVGRVSMYKY